MVLYQKLFLKKKKFFRKKSEKQAFAMIFSDLLLNGFSISESLAFLTKVQPKLQPVLSIFYKNLESGQLLYVSFDEIGFSKRYIAQLRLSEAHGDTIGTLRKISQHMLDSEKQKKAFLKIITYPALLLLFLLGMLAGMKWFLLPQLQVLQGGKSMKSNLGIWMIEFFPLIFGGLFVALITFFLFLRFFFEKLPPIKKNELFARIPFFRRFVQTYFTSYFCLEWGKLFREGLEMKRILELMAEDGNTNLMKSMSKELQKELSKGEKIYDKLSSWKFLENGLSVVLQQGEVKGKMGEELLLYGELCWKTLLEQTEKWIKLIQPIIFLFVAILIVCVYAALLLPMYGGNMEGFL